MKKLKNLFSFMLVAVFALTGTLMFTGCKEEKTNAETLKIELTKEQKTEVVETILNDTITKLEVAQMFDEGSAIQPKSEVNISVFDQFGEDVEGVNPFETLTSEYVNALAIDGEVGEIIEVCEVLLIVLKSENFEFDTKVSYGPEGDFDEEVNVKLLFNENNFIFGIYGETEMSSFYKFNYSNNSITMVETYNEGVYKGIIISTDDLKRALDSFLIVCKREGKVEGDVNVTAYFPIIYSEAEGKYFNMSNYIDEDPSYITHFIIGSETYGEMVDACKNIIDENQSLLESLI